MMKLPVILKGVVDLERELYKKIEEENKPKKWCQDYAMMIIAEYDKHAEKKARWSSDDFKKAVGIVVEKINLDQEKPY